MKSSASEPGLSLAPEVCSRNVCEEITAVSQELSGIRKGNKKPVAPRPQAPWR